VAGLESALESSAPFAMAQWATALLLSNEPGAPYSFSGAHGRRCTPAAHLTRARPARWRCAATGSPP